MRLRKWQAECVDQALNKFSQNKSGIKASEVSDAEGSKPTVSFKRGIKVFNIIIKNFEAFTSERFKNVKLIEVSTSGSTGLPFKVLQDKNKKNRNTADTLYFSEKAGFKIGYKLLYLRHWSTTYSKNKWIGWIQNILKIEVLDLNDKLKSCKVYVK